MGFTEGSSVLLTDGAVVCGMLGLAEEGVGLVDGD
jgi:hypothetical protein